MKILAATPRRAGCNPRAVSVGNPYPEGRSLPSPLGTPYSQTV